MRPPNALGKSTASASNASFLRRTEYITSSTAGNKSMFESSNSSNTMRLRKKRAKGNVHEDDPIHITRNILKGFNLAYPEDAYTGPDTTENLRPAPIDADEKRAWKAPKHPRNDKLELLESYPLLPDWDAIPDTGSYAMFKFTAAPVKDASTGLPTYNPRLDVSILRLAGETIEDRARFTQEQELYRQDPTLHPPLPWFHYEFFLPHDAAKVAGIKRNFATCDPDADDIPFDESLDDDGRPRKFFRYENVRTYETQSQVSNLNDRFGDTVALALHDPRIHKAPRLREGRMEKGAYFYPIGQKSHIRARRPGRVHMVEEFPKIDYLDAVGREADAEERRKRGAERRVYDPEAEVEV